MDEPLYITATIGNTIRSDPAPRLRFKSCNYRCNKVTNKTDSIFMRTVTRLNKYGTG